MEPLEGQVALWIETVDGVSIDEPNKSTKDEQAQQMVIFNAVDHGQQVEVILVIRRADLSRLLAFPNDPEHAVDTVILIKHAGDTYDGPEPLGSAG